MKQSAEKSMTTSKADAIAPPEAAVQFAAALLNAIKYSNYFEEIGTYWQEKLLLLSLIHNIPSEFMQSLLKDHSDPGVEKLFASTVAGDSTGVPERVPTLLVRLAISAGTQTPDPFRGVLAIGPNANEREIWFTGSRELSIAVESYKLASEKLLAGLLAASLPSLSGAKVPDTVLHDKGLSDREPQEADYW
jgi:hypothetical protein